jgi:HEAT repeat protein
VRDLVRSGPENDEPVRLSLLAMGPDAIPVLCRVFPGALWVDLSRPHRPLRSGRQISAVAACLADFGAAAAPHLASLLRAQRAEVRLAAALVAADIGEGTLVRPLAVRLWDEVPAVRHAAMVALDASAHLPETMLLRQELFATLRDPTTPEKWRKKAVWTLGQLRDAGAAALMVEQLAAESDVAKVARQALTLLIGRDLGRFRLRWHAFLRRHGDRSRVEWLIDALDQSDAAARIRVTEELILATGEGFDRRHAAASRETARELAEFYRQVLAAQSARG